MYNSTEKVYNYTLFRIKLIEKVYKNHCHILSKTAIISLITDSVKLSWRSYLLQWGFNLVT